MSGRAMNLRFPLKCFMWRASSRGRCARREPWATQRLRKDHDVVLIHKTYSDGSSAVVESDILVLRRFSVEIVEGS